MIEILELTEVGPARHLRVDFARRLNVFAGDNGLGKSFLLELAWWALTGQWADEPAMPRRGLLIQEPAIGFQLKSGLKSVFISNRRDTYWRPTGPETASDTNAIVLFARSDGGMCLFDPFMHERHQKPTLERLERLMQFNISEDGRESAPLVLTANEVWNGKRLNEVLCRGMIEDWRSWMEGDKETFVRLTKVLEALSPDQGVERLVPGGMLKVSVRNALEIPTLLTPYGQVPITHASAGIKRGLGLAYMLVWAWREHRKIAELLGQPPLDRMVLLFDEVEAHLHPKWQRVILPAVLDVLGMLDFTDTQILAVTHSPLVLASLETRFDPEQDGLFKFDLERDQVVVNQEHWRPRGDVSSWLTSDIFDLGEARSVEAERAIQAARQAMADPSLPIEEVRRIHHALHAVLKETDPFWPRWLARAAAAGIDP